ncbi:hypothetical protein K8Z61_11955 [Nocardioides sp. TRM66260-LWL]|uniref:hypothetical protein n=1 Tax=Nocardioides sp. TRM66260-LWL TaxID=2874478 RepID=UPI001CC74E00|nr:hypothetical protein [Nocardioides sp. TRM66260-LWL]MBZ5735210.1 hypothetical protein [Nocardioides sp. TRM66260-LWL]
MHLHASTHDHRTTAAAPRRRSRHLLRLLAVLAALVATAAPAFARAPLPPIEGYAQYQPQTRCSPKPKPGAVYLMQYLDRRFPGTPGGISRACDVGGRSEHKEGRALDWMVSARTHAGRVAARELLDWLFATDGHGEQDARARRLGVMYVIWNDRIYSSYDGFRPQPYLNAGCKQLKGCSPTLRHRDHVHISLDVAGGMGRTSWFVGRLTDAVGGVVGGVGGAVGGIGGAAIG